MSELAVTSIVFVCICIATALGMAIRYRLPAEDLDSDSRDVVRLVMAIVGSMAALVLSLILYSTNGSYNDRRNSIETMVAQVALLDTLLAHYGPETGEVRDLLRQTVVTVRDQLWPAAESLEVAPAPATIAPGGRALLAKVLALSPADELQTILKTQALQLTLALGTAREQLIAQEKSRAIPAFFIVVVVAWLALLYASFGLFAPPNRVVIASLFLSALSVSGAILLILELARPFEGLIRISPAPVESMLAALGQ
jgi:hypothetical protein